MRVLLTGLMLMVVTTLPLPNTVEAQGVGAQPNKFRALVVGVGTTQSLNLYIQYNMHRGANSGQQSEPGVQGVTIILQNPNLDAGHEEVCRQTIHVQVDVTPGLLNTVSLGIRSGEEEKELLVNGVVEEILDDCFDETNRVVYNVLGDLNDFQFGDPLPAASTPLERIGGIMIYDVTDPNGATAASGPAGVFTISATFENNVVGLGLGEGVEFYYGEKPSQGKPQGPPPSPGDTVVFTYVVTNTGDATCTQTIQIEELEIAHEGLIMHSIAKGSDFVTFNDGDLIELKQCFYENSPSQRVAIQVSIRGGDRGFKLPENNSPFPTTVPAGFPHLKELGYSIYDIQTGATRAEQWLGSRVIASQKAGVPLP